MRRDPLLYIVKEIKTICGRGTGGSRWAKEAVRSAATRGRRDRRLLRFVKDFQLGDKLLLCA